LDGIELDWIGLGWIGLPSSCIALFLYVTVYTESVQRFLCTRNMVVATVALTHLLEQQQAFLKTESNITSPTDKQP
jgi:hypothetical protein